MGVLAETTWTFGLGLLDLDFWTWTFGLGLSDLGFRTWTFRFGRSDLDFRTWTFGLKTIRKVTIMGSFKVNIMVSIMVSQILTKNSFKSGNGLVISPLLRDFYLTVILAHTCILPIIVTFL